MVDFTLNDLLKEVVINRASDLHLLVNSEPKIRVDGGLKSLEFDKLENHKLKELCYSILSNEQKEKLIKDKELDFAISIPNIARFRGNYYFERQNISAAFRIIPEELPTIDDFHFPEIIRDFTKKEKGLILVTGPTGSGKSTTMAAMINEINLKQSKHIITIEDPVEFIHPHKNSIVSQRNVGEDTKSFATALKYALRQDPDIIYVGEMRDKETISAAITAAETGHLVFGTLHTNSAPSTINRIINVFPSSEQDMIRTQLSMSLVGIVSQILVPKIGGGRVGIQEILVMNNAISNLIREDKQHQIYAQMQLNQQHTKMQTQTQELIKAIRQREITKEDALKFASNKDEIKNSIGFL